MNIEELKESAIDNLKSDITVKEQIYWIVLYKLLTDKRLCCKYETGTELVRLLMKNAIDLSIEFRNPKHMIIKLK